MKYKNLLAMSGSIKPHTAAQLIDQNLFLQVHRNSLLVKCLFFLAFKIKRPANLRNILLFLMEDVP